MQPFAVQISVRFYLDIRYKIPNFDSVTKSNKTDLWKRNQEKRPGKVEPEKVPEERLCPACTPRIKECVRMIDNINQNRNSSKIICRR